MSFLRFRHLPFIVVLSLVFWSCDGSTDPIIDGGPDGGGDDTGETGGDDGGDTGGDTGGDDGGDDTGGDDGGDTGGSPPPEPFPDCPPDRICTYTIHLQRGYRPEHRDLVRRFDYVIVNKNSLDSGMSNAPDASVPVIFYETLQYRQHFCEPNCPFEDWETVDANEDWFWHDASGNRVGVERPLSDFPPTNWYMDYRNTDYLDYLVERFGMLQARYPSINGFFIDQNGFYDGFSAYAVPRMVPNPIDPLPTREEYDAYNVFALNYLEERFGSMHLVVNSNNYAGFNEVVDGSMNEGFVHDNQRGDQDLRPLNDWIGDIETLGDPSNADRFVFVFPKSKTEEAAPRIMRYALASFLLGRRDDAHSFFCFESPPGPMPLYHDEYDTPTGRPLGPYYRDRSGLYVREFENGIAVVHPDNSSGHLTLHLAGDLEGSYVDWDGECHDSHVTLDPNTGQFLLESDCSP